MYEKHNWVTGEVITAENLNHLEDGVASGGVVVVNATYIFDGAEETYEITDLTCLELYNLLNQGKTVLVKAVIESDIGTDYENVATETDVITSWSKIEYPNDDDTYSFRTGGYKNYNGGENNHPRYSNA